MKKRAKRLTALLLSLAMALSMLTATAWAAPGTGTSSSSSTTSTSESSSAVAGSMGILDALDDTTLSAIVAVAEAEAAAASANSNDGIATISDDEDDEDLGVVMAAVEEEADNITVIDEETGESTGLTDTQLQTVLYLYNEYLTNYNENVGYLGRQTPWFTQYEEDSEDGLGPLGSMLVLAGTTVDAVRNGEYTYDELVGTIYTFWYGNKYGVEYYGSDILAAKNDALSAVESSGATTDAQKLLVLNDWLADNVSFDMAYIMNMSSDDYDMMSAPEPVNSEHYNELYQVFYSMYYDSILEQVGGNETYAEIYTAQAADQMVTAVEGMWNGCLIGALALGKGVCMAYTSAYTYLVQWMNPDVYSVNGTLTTDSSTWKTVEELNYVTTTENVTTSSTDWDGTTYYSVTTSSSGDENPDSGENADDNENTDGGENTGDNENIDGGENTGDDENTDGSENTDDNENTDSDENANDNANSNESGEAATVAEDDETEAESTTTLDVTTGTTETNYPLYVSDGADGYVQATDENGNKLYVQDYDESKTTTDNTGYPVYVTSSTTETETVYTISTDAAYIVDFVMIVYNASVTMYGESNPDFSSQHFWNAVKVDGEWYYIDTCYIDTYTESMSRDRVETIGDMNHVYFLMSDTSARSMYDGYYSALYTLYTDVATDQSYENTTWMYYAASNVYSDGNGNFYYAYDSTDLLDTMAQFADYNSGTSTVAAADDYSDWEDDTEYKIVYHAATSSDKDTAEDYVTLIDITGGQVRNASGTMEDNELIQELYAEHLEYEELYPSLALTMALYDGVIYFNLANCVLSYDLDTCEVVKVKEYNDVYAVRDTSEAFGGMAFSVTYDEDDYDVYESNPPIAGLAIYDDTLYVDVASNYAYISGKDDINDLTSYGWEYQESNYNSSYSSWLSMIDMSDSGYDLGDYMDDENDNDEFMWSANFTDAISMSTVTSSSLEYEEVYVEATCGRNAFTENRSEEGLIEDGTRVEVEDTACEHHFVEFDETYYTKDDNENWNTGVNYVCTICGLSVTDEDTDEDEVEVTYEQAAALAAEGHTYVATEDGITWAEDYSSATVTDLVCDVCGDMKTNTVYVATVTENDDGTKTVTNSGETETVYNRDCLNEDDTIEVTLDEELTCDVTSEVTGGTCTDGLITTYYAVGPEGSDYEGQILGSYEVQGEAGVHDYVVEEDDWTWTENEDGTYSAVATVMTCSVCGDTQEDVEAVVTSETTPATCTEAGATVYTAVATAYDEDGETVLGTATGTLTVEIEALGHTYETTWAWADDYSTATATRTCSVCGDTETVDAEVTYETADATCTTGGTVTYTATATFSDESTDSTSETVEVDALGHDYEAEWTWAEDYSTATATLTCSRCDDVQTVTASVDPVTTPATCTEAGETVYTATAELDGVTYTDTKTVEIPATGHDWAATVWGEWTEADDGYTITATRTCSTCGVVDTAEVTVTASSGDATCTEAGTVTYTAVATYSDGTTENAPESKTVEGVALGHDYGEPEWTWAADNSTATATFTCSRCGDTQTVTGDATQGEDGTYTVTVTFNGVEYTASTEPYDTGLYKKSDGDWYYYVDGVWQSDYTGLVKYTNGSGSWWYVVDGKINFNYTGLVKYVTGSWYYVVNGKVDYSATGLVKHSTGSWWYVVNGRMQSSYNGFVKHTSGSWYLVEAGKVNKSYTGLAKHTTGTWYYAEKGIINFKFTGIVPYSNGKSYYVVKGRIDRTYTGTVTYNGKTYKVVNGIVS